MENYSLQMQLDLAKQLRKTATPDLLAMLPYFEQRQGPGLVLLQAELSTRTIQKAAA